MSRLLLDELARIVARQGPDNSEPEEPFTRAAVVKRGLMGTLMLASLGHLAFPERSSGAGCPGGSLQACLGRADKLYRELLRDCGEKDDFPRKLLCYRNVNSSDRKRLNNVCRKSCPPSKPKARRSSKPPPPAPAQPPPLPANPYDGLVAECANCTVVGGKCCYGGKDPLHLCVCGNPGYPCSRQPGCTD